jgi:hypothetical protein
MSSYGAWVDVQLEDSCSLSFSFPRYGFKHKPRQEIKEARVKKLFLTIYHIKYQYDMDTTNSSAQVGTCSSEGNLQAQPNLGNLHGHSRRLIYNLVSRRR